MVEAETFLDTRGLLLKDGVSLIRPFFFLLSISLK